MRSPLRTGWFRSAEKADAIASHLFNLGYASRVSPCGPWTLLEFWRNSK